MSVDYLGNEIPPGRNLTTYDPASPSTPGDNYRGFLISSGSSKATIVGSDISGPVRKRLVALVAGQDSQEQAAARAVYRITDILLNPSEDDQQMAGALLRQFDFVVFPFMCQANVRDGRSRYSLDGPHPGAIGPEGEGNDGWAGYSAIGREVLTQFIQNWASDHPDPTKSVFCIATFHNDVLNEVTTTPGSSPRVTSPYALIYFPGYAAGEGHRYFRDPSLVDPQDPRPGFADVSWKEYFWADADNIKEGTYGYGLPDPTPYGGTGFYFELPWAGTAQKASHWFDDEDAGNFAHAFLTGINTVGQGEEEYSGPVAVGASAAVTVSGTKALGGGAAVAGVARSTASGIKNIPGQARISASSGATASGSKVGFGGVNVSGGRVTVAGSKDAGGEAHVAGTAGAAVAGTPLEVREGTASVSGAASVTARGLKSIRGPAHVACAPPTVTVVGRKDATGTASVVGVGGVATSGVAQPLTTGVVSISASASVTVRGTKEAAGPVHVTGRAAVDAAPLARTFLSISMVLYDRTSRVRLTDRSPDARLVSRTARVRLTQRSDADG